MTNDERAAYLALALAPGIGMARLRTALSACSTAIGAHSAPFELLCSLPGISRATATAIKTARVDAAATILTRAAALGAEAVFPSDQTYPELLRHIESPPTALFVLGDPSLFRRPAAAVVGSRDHSMYGAEICRAVSAVAAEAGIVVVSGMARGLDAVAHTAVLDRGGDTIGVLGNGLGVVYPAANRSLYDRVAAKGLLMTEFPPGERPGIGSFPRRNRLISGLCRVTIVIEAAAGSGTLITVNAALDQGRDVLAVPGNLTSAVSAGTNRLIHQGATPYLEPADLLDLFEDVVRRRTAAAPVEPQASTLAGLSAEERRIVTAIGTTAIHVDDLAGKLGQPIASVVASVGALEIAGILAQGPGRLVRRAR